MELECEGIEMLKNEMLMIWNLKELEFAKTYACLIGRKQNDEKQIILKHLKFYFKLN